MRRNFSVAGCKEWVRGQGCREEVRMRPGCVATAHHVVEILDLALHKERPPTLFVLAAGLVILNQNVSLR